MDVDKDRPGALVGTHSVRLDDEWTFDAGEGESVPKSQIPPGWTATFEVTPEGTTEANFELSQR